MKKLIIAVAIVCTAVLAQAGSVKWNLYDVASPSEGYAYLFNSADVAYATVDAVVASISANTFATTYADNAAKATDFEESISMGKAIDAISGSTTLWMIAVDNASNPTKVFVGDEITKTIGSSGSQNFSWTYNDNTSAWTPVGGSPVPEPTSGLLLLLGVAGLALKRKRA